MEKHTPGPWYCSPQKNYVRANGIHGWNICEIEDQPPYTEANAKLISAAPELLEALQTVMQDEMYCDITWKSKLVIEEAIKKATL